MPEGGGYRLVVMSSLGDAVSARSTRADGWCAWTYRPQLDGVRALAVTLVLLFHLELGWFPGGFLGVDVFFVLSGFLITGLLIDEAARDGSIRLVRFYARRARRLLPAAWAVIGFVLVIGMIDFNPMIFLDRQHEASAALLYVANWDWILRDAEYGSPGDIVSPLIHFWSLGVEEQFYLVWPPLVLLVWVGVRRARVQPRTVLLVVLAVVAGVSATWAVVATPSPAAYYGTHTRAFELAAGGLVAVALRRRDAPGEANARPSRAWESLTLAGAAIGLGILLWQARAIVGTTDYPGVDALVVTLGAALVIAAVDVHGGTLSARAIGNPVFAWVGRLSYSLYLWHWPLIVFFRDDLGPSLVPVIVVVSWLCYTLLEQPVRRRVWPSLRPAWVVATGLTVSVGLGLVAVPALFRTTSSQDLVYIAAHDFADPGDCPYSADQWPSPEDAQPCVLRTGLGQTVAFVGDSHAHQWQPALMVLAEQRDWTLLRVTRGACAAPDVIPMRGDGAGGSEPDLSCAAWRHALYPRLIEAYDPDLVFVATRSQVVGLAAEADRTVDTGDREHLPMWTDAWGWTLDTLGAGGATMVVSAILPTMPKHVPSCLARSGLSSARCDFSSADPLAAQYSNALDDLVTERGDAVMVSPVDFICPAGTCPAVDDGLIVRRDTDHVTATYVGAHAAEFGALLDAAVGSTAR